MVDVVGKNVPVVSDAKVQNANKVATDSIEIDTSSTASIKIGELLSGKKAEKNNDLEKMFDFDGNGKLDEAEKAALEAYQDIKMFDINGDGKLDDAEKAAKKAYKEVKMFDFNKNGKLDPEEKAALDAWKKAQEKPKPAPWPWIRKPDKLGPKNPLPIIIDEKAIDIHSGQSISITPKVQNDTSTVKDTEKEPLDLVS